MNRLLNKESSEDDVGKHTVKKRKVKVSSGKCQKVVSKTNDKSSGDIDIQSPHHTARSSSGSLSKANLAIMHKEPDGSQNMSCSDSTSDTSDEDQNYIPFNTKSKNPRGRGKPRGRGGVRRSRGSRRTEAKK